MKDRTTEGRNTNIEILRCILIMAVCFWHVIIHGFKFMTDGLGGVIPYI